MPLVKKPAAFKDPAVSINTDPNALALFVDDLPSVNRVLVAFDCEVLCLREKTKVKQIADHLVGQEFFLLLIRHDSCRDPFFSLVFPP